MKRAILACLAAFALCSGCIFDDEFWEDCYDCGYEDDEEYFNIAPTSSSTALEARPR